MTEETYNHLKTTKADEFLKILEGYREDLNRQSEQIEQNLEEAGITKSYLYGIVNATPGLNDYFWFMIKGYESCIIDDVMRMLLNPDVYAEFRNEYLKEEK